MLRGKDTDYAVAISEYQIERKNIYTYQQMNEELKKGTTNLSLSYSFSYE